mgnify:CR=1 FL=1
MGVENAAAARTACARTMGAGINEQIDYDTNVGCRAKRPMASHGGAPNQVVAIAGQLAQLVDPELGA